MIFIPFKEWDIDGVLATPHDVTEDQVYKELVAFVESKGWHFGGKIQEITEEEDDSSN